MRTSLFAILGLFIVLCHPTFGQRIRCIGKTKNPVCEVNVSKSKCIATVDQDDRGYISSCAWLGSYKGTSQLIFNYTVTRGNSPMLRRQELPESFCVLQARIALPAESQGAWSTYMRLEGMPNPRINSYPWGGGMLPLATSACTAGGVPSSSGCTISLVPPRNLANTPPFNSIDIYTEYFASHPDLIQEMKKYKGFGYLTPVNYLSMRYVLSLKPCVLIPETTPATGISDSVIFGSSPYYSGYSFDAPYVLLDYKSYVITNVSAASWSVDANLAMDITCGSSRRTPVSVMLLQESDFQNWEKGCKDKACEPPKASALPGTYCKAFTCNGKASGLDGMSGNRTRLLVSWPWVTTYGSRNKTSDKTPTISPYDSELVRVKIVPTYAYV